MIGITGTGTTAGMTAGTVSDAPDDDDEELLDEERVPPPPAPLKREPTEAVEAKMADVRRAPKVEVPVANGDKRLSSRSIWNLGSRILRPTSTPFQTE